MTPKVALQKIRKLAKRGSNEMLQRAIEEVYMAGIKLGMQRLSEELKGRLNDNQSVDNGPDPDRERGVSDSPESGGGPGTDPDDFYRNTGSARPVPSECLD